VAALALGSIAAQTRLDAPPRFDGAGYAVLAEALRTGQGYRAIDRPDAPRHAHFPPGYPLLLAALWRVTGPSAPAAHALSAACTTAAVLLTWRWLTRRYRPRVALLLGCALAVNWTWGRIGSAIQSEPLFLLLLAASLNAADRAARGPAARGVVLGVLLGAATLTRHVGVMVAVALILELLLRRRRATAAASALTFALLLAPWAAWLAIVRVDTQIAKVPVAGLPEVVGRQVVFYVQRIPDAIVGPLVEIGTVFRPQWRVPATLLAAAATCVVLLGWLRCLRSRRRRVAALVPLAMLALLLVWPFQEAGRFLVPLVPFLLVGAMEGLAVLIATLGARASRPQSGASRSLPPGGGGFGRGETPCGASPASADADAQESCSLPPGGGGFGRGGEHVDHLRSASLSYSPTGSGPAREGDGESRPARRPPLPHHGGGKATRAAAPRRALAGRPLWGRIRTRERPRLIAAALVLAAPLPYTLYAILTRRADAAERAQAPFDAACAWIAAHGADPGPLLVRQAGEAFWLLGRVRATIAPPGDAQPDAINALIDRYAVAYLIDDEARYARAPTSPIGRFAAARPDRVVKVWEQGPVTIYAVRHRARVWAKATASPATRSTPAGARMEIRLLMRRSEEGSLRADRRSRVRSLALVPYTRLC
jgi:hypothetical protein